MSARIHLMFYNTDRLLAVKINIWNIKTLETWS